MRRSFSRTLNGPGALVPSPMFVAATVRLLLGRRRRSSTRRRARSSTRWPPSGGGTAGAGIRHAHGVKGITGRRDDILTRHGSGRSASRPPRDASATPGRSSWCDVLPNTLQADALKLVAEELRSALAAGGGLPEDWLAAFGDGGSDLLMALVRSP